MKQIFTLFFLLISFHEMNGQWYKLDPPPTNAHLRTVFFINEAIGWIGGSAGAVMKTTNGGRTWLAQTISSSTTVYDIHFFNESTGILCCGNGKIYKTTNGGDDWVEKSAGGSYNLFELYFIDSQHGFSVGGPAIGGGVIRVTSNGGENWAPMSYGFNQLRTVHFFTQGYGLVSGADGKFWKTTNSGEDWDEVGSSPTGTIFKFFYLTQNLSYSASTAGTILKTNSGDTLWTAYTIPGLSFSTSAYSLFFLSSNEGWVVMSEGKIAHTSSGALNWDIQNSNTSENLYDVFFIDANHGYIVGNSGTLLSTFPLVSVEDDILSLSGEFELLQNYPNPFNPSTKISWQSPVSGWQTLKVYDVLGNEVATLVDEYKPAGDYNVEFRIENLELCSGVYFYQLRIGEFVQTKKMILLR